MVRVQRWSDLSDIPADLGATVVTLGNFDGVHRGHRAVLAHVVALAAERGLTSVAVTFEPHPLAVLAPQGSPQIITAPEHRLALLDSLGLGAVLVMQFTRELASWTPERFVQEIFVQALGAQVVVVGRDTRFGAKNSGDVQTLRRLGADHGFEVVTVDDQGIEGPEHARWSSTQVRRLLADGDVAGAAAVLGRPHRVTGEVVHGDHRGRDLGYPTANLGQDLVGLVPADGVYAGWLVRPELPETDPDRTLPAAISIGTNPTFQGSRRRVEAYVLDRTDLELYGETVSMEFVERLRPTLTFDVVDELIEQMAHDVARSRQALSTMVPPIVG